MPAHRPGGRCVPRVLRFLLAGLVVTLSLASCKPEKPESPPSPPDEAPATSKPGCASDGLTCNGVCVDLSSDEQNCGVCGKVCGAGETCGMGICTRRCEGVTTLSPTVGSAMLKKPASLRTKVGAAADFNGDGRIDFVTEGGVMLGEEGGLFRKTSQVPTGNFGEQVGDFTGDGLVDVLLPSRAGDQGRSFVIIPGKGNGTFGFGLNAGLVSFTAYAVADVDLDGITDVVTVDQPTGAVLFLKGQITASFASGVPLASPFPASLLGLADVTGDGKPDLVLASDTQLAVSPGAGNGTFGAAQVYPLAFTASTLAFGALDATAGQDIVASGPQGLSVLRATGGGTFQLTQAAGMRGSLLIADVNGDQKGDLISSRGVISVELGRGDGSFEPPSAYRFLPIALRAVWVGNLVKGPAVDLVVTDDVSGIYVVPGTGTGGFEAEPALPAGGGLIGAGDFNGDAKPDFAVFDPSWNTVALFVARAQGGFLPPSVYRYGPGALQFTWDFNEDGRTDLLLFDGSQLKVGSVSAAGVLETGPTLDTGNVKAIVVGHFDTDSHLDLALLDRSHAEVRILAGLGDGRFALASKTAVQYVRDFRLPAELSTGDLNGDGKTDLLLTNGNESLLLGNGDRTFQPELLVRTSSMAFYTVTAADMDGDGHQDLVEAPNGDWVYEETVLLRRGQGDGTFASATALRSQPGRVMTRDFDGDGRTDFFQWGDLFLRRADGTYKAVPGITGFDAAFADFDGDGRLDAMMSLFGGGAQLRSNMLEDPPGGTLFVSKVRVGGVAALDTDGDGQMDLAFEDVAGGLNVVRGVPGTGLQFPVLRQDVSLRPSVLRTGDFDQDGRVDLATSIPRNGRSTVTVLRGQGNGTFEPSSVDLEGTGSLVGQGDLNGDGRPELLAALYTGGFSTVQFESGQGLRLVGSFPEVNLWNRALAVLDLNRDGYQDLLVDSHDNTPFMVPLLQNEQGQFEPGESTAVRSELSYGSLGALLAGDLNGDGVKDVLASTWGLTSVLRNAEGSFGAQRPHPDLDTNHTGRYALADFNGDGVLDVVLDNGGLVMALGDGAGGFTRPTRYPQLWSLMNQLAVGDFNGDAHPDVAVSGDYEVRVLYGTCQPGR